MAGDQTAEQGGEAIIDMVCEGTLDYFSPIKYKNSLVIHLSLPSTCFSSNQSSP